MEQSVHFWKLVLRNTFSLAYEENGPAFVLQNGIGTIKPSGGKYDEDDDEIDAGFV